MSFKKKKAFTLTELLVVVVIIGILATVALPKFNKVLVTRRTTEAEEMMRAIRTEQERRCALDKPYATDFAALSDIVPSTSTDSYDYVAQAAGMNARSKQLNYQLQMPSYADGRICCEGDGCSQLNKDYPTCEALKLMPDYQAPDAACAASLPGETEDPGSCSTPQPADEEEPCSAGKCGKRTRSYVCNQNGQWVPGQWHDGCVPIPDPTVLPPIPITCEGGEAGHKTCTTSYTCEGDALQPSTQCEDDCPCTKLVWVVSYSNFEAGSCPPNWSNEPEGECSPEGAVESGTGCLYPSGSGQTVPDHDIYLWQATCTKVPCDSRWEEINTTQNSVPTHGWCSCPVVPNPPSGACTPGSTTTWEECINPNHPNPPDYSNPPGTYCGFDYHVHYYRCQ